MYFVSNYFVSLPACSNALMSEELSQILLFATFRMSPMLFFISPGECTGLLQEGLVLNPSECCD